MSADRQQTAQRIVGWVCALSMVVLAWASLVYDATLGWPTVVALVTTIAMLLGKMDDLAEVIESYRGSQSQSNEETGGKNDGPTDDSGGDEDDG